MKRLYAAAALMFFSLFVCIFSSVKIEKSSLQICNELNQIGTVIASGDSEQAITRLNEAEKHWDKTETLFSLIIDADKIEEMNVGISMIKAHLEDKNEEHALERLRECVLMLEEIKENEKLNFKNIM